VEKADDSWREIVKAMVMSWVSVLHEEPIFGDHHVTTRPIVEHEVEQLRAPCIELCRGIAGQYGMDLREHGHLSPTCPGSNHVVHFGRHDMPRSRWLP
jgi:hypothetical protein